MTSIASKIVHRIRVKGRGWVFAPKDFVDFGTRASVDVTLMRLVKKGFIRRLGRGCYDFPKQHDTLGTLSPRTDDVAQVAAAKTGDTIFPSGAQAANMLGLSTQVPARPVYLTNGATRTHTIDGRRVRLKHARVPILNQMPDKINTILQALSYLGKRGIDDTIIHQCAGRIDSSDLPALMRAARHTPGWLSDALYRIQQIKDGQIRHQP